MNTTIADALAADLAALALEAPAPSIVSTASQGYGTDLSCVTDLEPNLAEVDGSSKFAISQALLRRLITPRGSLLDDADYGFDLRGWCNAGVTDRDLLSVQGLVRGECRKDDRVDDVTVSATYDTSDNRLGVQLIVAPVSLTLGIFTLTFSVTNSTALLESIF